MTNEILQDKARGCLVGGAVGDAFGYPVEFVSSYEEIRAKYGEDGITEYDRSYPWPEDYRRHSKALFSDDTQMTLYTAEGLLEAEKCGRPIIPTVCNSYIAWYGRQVGKKVRIAYKSELAQIDELNQQRAPGNTCLSALAAIYNGREPMNASKGCGGIMRVAPVGIYGASRAWELAKTATLAGEVAEITHLHQLSTYSSAALAVMVQQCLESDKLTKEEFKRIIGNTISIVREVYGSSAPSMDDFETIILKADRHEDNPLPDWEIIESELGGGWVSEETLGIAIFCVLRHFDDFNGCIISAVNHGGDSDSTGAVAGNIIGAMLGYDALPAKFTDTLQLKELIIKTADRLS